MGTRRKGREKGEKGKEGGCKAQHRRGFIIAAGPFQEKKGGRGRCSLLLGEW